MSCARNLRGAVTVRTESDRQVSHALREGCGVLRMRTAHSMSVEGAPETGTTGSMSCVSEESSVWEDTGAFDG